MACGERPYSNVRTWKTKLSRSVQAKHTYLLHLNSINHGNIKTRKAKALIRFLSSRAG